MVNFPKDFDKYDAKVTDKTRLTANGVEGNMVYDFLAVPRNQGSYTIPSVEFTYYDTSKNAYKTIKTQPFKLEVEKGDGSTGESEDFASQDKDIHTIKLGKVEQHKANEMFFGSFGYWVSLLMPLIAFVVLLIVFHRRAIENADIVKKRSNRAGKIATKRLRLANKLMLQGKQGEFYDEVMRALWGYMSYKLNMPAEKLNRDNIRETLARHFVDDATIEKFTTALDECEFERYAPGDDDINFNLQFARSKTIDKITPESEMFFVTWYKSLVNFTSVDNWAKTGILCIVLALLLVLLYLFGPQLMLRKIGFFGGLSFFVIFLLSNLFAYQQKQALDNRTGAIIMAPSVNIKKTPAKNSADQFVLHEGTRVDIIDKGMTDWRCIRVGDGREGWIETKAIEEI